MVDLPSVVIVSPYFPPSNLAGVHRARHLAKHLPTYGWRPIVLCVDEKYHEGPVAAGFEKFVPDTVEVVKVSAFPTNLSRSVGLGEISLRAWFQLRHTMFRLIKTRDAKAILVTGSPFYPMALAPSIKRRFEIPVLLDFQDPWVSSWGAEQPRLSKAGISNTLASLLEPKAVRSADFITAISERQNEDMRQRYPDIPAERMAAIPIGGDPDDFRHPIAKQRPADDMLLDRSFVNFSYIGTYWPRAEPTIRLLFKALRKLHIDRPDLSAKIRMNFIGTSYAPGESQPAVLPLAKAEGVDGLVREIPDRLSYLLALELMAASDVLLLIGSDEPHYSASKTFPILMSGKPYLALLHSESSARQILENAGGGKVFCFAGSKELAALEEPLSKAISMLTNSRDGIISPDPRAYEHFTADSIASQYAKILNGLTGRG